MKNKQTKPQGYYCKGNVRITKSIKDHLKAIALETHTTESEVIRQAILEQINTRLSDKEIMHAQLADLTKQMHYMEDKLELLGLVIMQQARLLLQKLPTVSTQSSVITDKLMQEFKDTCSRELRQKGNMLEAMVLQAYEQGE